MDWPRSWEPVPVGYFHPVHPVPRAEVLKKDLSNERTLNLSVPEVSGPCSARGPFSSRNPKRDGFTGHPEGP